MQPRPQTVRARCLKSFILDGKVVHYGNIVTLPHALFRTFYSAGLVEDAPVVVAASPEATDAPRKAGK